MAGSSSLGTGANQFNFPFGLAFDSQNVLYVGDMNNSRVQQWAINGWTGATVAGQSSGTSGSALNQLNKAGGIAIDSGGNIYIADTYNSRVQYWANGASTGSTIAGTGKFHNLCQSSQSINRFCFNSVTIL